MFPDAASASSSRASSSVSGDWFVCVYSCIFVYILVGMIFSMACGKDMYTCLFVSGAG